MASPRKSKASDTPVNAHLDEALFVPRLDQLVLTDEAAGGAGPEYSDLIESICGVTDDSQAVEQYDGTLGVSTSFVGTHQRPVAQVQWNNNLATVFTNPGNVNDVRWGSGTMIGPDLFLTCGHLFDPAPNGWTIPRQNGTSSPLTPQQAATNMHLNFNYQVDSTGTLRPEQSFPITQLIEYRLNGLDMALCRIGGSPGNIYGWSEFATTNATVGDMLAIIGHPAGMPKRVEAGPATSSTASDLRYNDIDTLGGNSGSGVLHSPSGRIVGVHTNGGCTSSGGSNRATPIAAIIAASPTLQSTTPSSSTGNSLDKIGTSLASDIGTSLSSDLGTVKALDAQDTAFIADKIGTNLAADLGTMKTRDTHLALDNPGTPIAADNILGTRFGRDVVPIDPNNTIQEGIVDPGSVVVDPVVFGRGGRRPFVLGGQRVPMPQEAQYDEVDLGEAVLAEIEGLMEITSAVLESLAALHQVLSEGQA